MKTPHTIQEDFDHFLAYSNQADAPKELIEKLFAAFSAAWEPSDRLSAEAQALREAVLSATEKISELSAKLANQNRLYHLAVDNQERLHADLAALQMNNELL